MQRGGSLSRRDGATCWRLLPVASRYLCLLGALVAVVGLTGCASVSEKIASTMSGLPAIGLPADAPQRQAEPTAYPAVHDMPPPRTNVVLTDIEQQKLENDLVAARKRQQAVAGAAPPEPPQAPASPPRLISTSSRGTIY